MSLLNKNINGYDITKSLGQGAFGEVYIGEKNSIKYVLKFIKIAQGLDKNNKYKNNVLSIISEIYALKKISENNEKCTLTTNNSALCLIETFINFDSNPPTFCIVTNYLENAVELSKVIYNRSDYVLKLDDIIFIMSKLIYQLAQLHQYNIVHSDIKPENIIVQTTNDENEQGLKEIHNVIFIDYGVSCLENCLPSGTLPYAAPEILPIIGTADKERLKKLRNELHYDKLSSTNKSYKIYNDKYKIPFSKEDYKKTDVYSLGVAFYKLLNDIYPYPFKSDYKKTKKTKSNKSQDSDVSYNSDDSDYVQTKTEYYDYPEDVIRDFQNQMPLLSYYHKHKSLMPSEFSLSKNDDINIFLNRIVDSMITLNPLKRPTIFQIKNTFDAFKKDFRSNYQARDDLYSPSVNNLLSIDTSREKLFNLNKFKLSSPSSGSLLRLNDPPVPKKRNSSINLSESQLF